MSTKTTGLILMIAGILGALFSALVDVIGLGNPAIFGYIQIFWILVGAVLFVAGITIYRRQQ